MQCRIWFNLDAVLIHFETVCAEAGGVASASGSSGLA